MTLKTPLLGKQARQMSSEETISNEVLNRFTCMLDGMDFQAQLDILNIRRLQFVRKKKALKELRAMYVGLWKLALNKSFPKYARQLFDQFLYTYGRKNNLKGHKADEFHTLSHEYADTLEVEGETNFINVAILMCQHLDHTEQEDLRRVSLQLALEMRAMYQNLFERLI